MGRFRESFAGKFITFRVPYIMYGELLVANGTLGLQYPEATFLHNVDKPFEIHRLIPRITPFNNAATPVVITPSDLMLMNNFETVLGKYIKLRILDLSKNEAMTKVPSLSGDLSRTWEQTWEFEDPYTIVRSEGFQITVDSNCPNFALGGTTVANLRVEVALEGYLLVIAPASETR